MGKICLHCVGPYAVKVRSKMTEEQNSKLSLVTTRTRLPVYLLGLRYVALFRNQSALNWTGSKIETKFHPSKNTRPVGECLSRDLKLSPRPNPCYTFDSGPLREVGDSTHFLGDISSVQNARQFLGDGGTELQVNQLFRVHRTVIGAPLVSEFGFQIHCFLSGLDGLKV